MADLCVGQSGNCRGNRPLVSVPEFDKGEPRSLHSWISRAGAHREDERNRRGSSASEGQQRRCAFSSSLTATRPSAILNFVRAFFTKLPHGLFSLLFPDNCRICDSALTGWTRVPVCVECLEAPKPFCADYFCVSCGTPFRNQFPLDNKGQCGLCRQGLRGFDQAYCYGEYDGTLRELIHLFKYRGMKPVGERLARYLPSALPVDLRIDLVVPVPLDWRKRWKRGFNQAEILASHVAKRRGWKLAQPLRRKFSTAHQATLSNTERRLNVERAFEGRTSVSGLRVLLVDDVMTTGATARACALALKRAGASSVVLLTLARVDRRLAVPAGQKLWEERDQNVADD